MCTHTSIHVLETTNDLRKQMHAHAILVNAFGKKNDSTVSYSFKNAHKKKEKEKIERLNIRLFISPGERSNVQKERNVGIVKQKAKERIRKYVTQSCFIL
jgi:hypothetical protein